MFMHWEGFTPHQYDTIRNIVQWEPNVPEGLILHIVSFNDWGAHITDAWENAENFNSFVEHRSMPAVQQAGIPGQPQVNIHPLHAIFAPAFEEVEA